MVLSIVKQIILILISYHRFVFSTVKDTKKIGGKRVVFCSVTNGYDRSEATRNFGFCILNFALKKWVSSDTRFFIIYPIPLRALL